MIWHKFENKTHTEADGKLSLRAVVSGSLQTDTLKHCTVFALVSFLEDQICLLSV